MPTLRPRRFRQAVSLHIATCGTGSRPGWPRGRGLLLMSVALCAWSLCGPPALGSEQVSGQAYAIPAVQPDQQIEALMRKAEKQISSGHTVSPEDDNALTTWQTVVRTASSKSPAALRALADSVAYMRRRSDIEKAAGRKMVSIDLSVFADLAEDILVHAETTEKPAVTAMAAPEPQLAPEAGSPATAPQPDV